MINSELYSAINVSTNSRK